LNFELYEYNQDSVILVGAEKVSFILRYADKEKTIAGKTANPKTVILEFSDELINIFSLEEDITFRVTITDYLGMSKYYQFVFKPVNFTKAYEQLKAMGENTDKK